MGEFGSNRNGTNGTVPSPCLPLAVLGNGVLVFSLSFIGGGSESTSPASRRSGFRSGAGGEGRGVLHLFAMNDRPREATWRPSPSHTSSG